MSFTTFESSSSSRDSVSSILQAMGRIIDEYTDSITKLMREIEEMEQIESPTDGNSDKIGGMLTKLDDLKLRVKTMKEKMHELADDDQNPEIKQEAEEMVEKASNEWGAILDEVKEESGEVERVTEEWLEMTSEMNRLPSILEEAEPED